MSSSANKQLVRHLLPTNFLSFGPDNVGIELNMLNLLIGPNGSGKSNLIEAISLMRATTKDLQEVTRKGGGVSEWIWKGSSALVASVQWQVQRGRIVAPLHHNIAFISNEQRFWLVGEDILGAVRNDKNEAVTYFLQSWDAGPKASYPSGSKGERKWAEVSLKPHSSVLSSLRDSSRYPELFFLTQSYERIRIYREWTFGRNAVFRDPQRADMPNDVLEEDFSNLGLFLSRINVRFPAAKRAIIENLRDLYEGLTDFSVHTEGGTVQVFFNEGDFVIPATRLSDGTLRYLCLLAILCDPEPPPLICIEEPELGLHPDILPKIADLLKEASTRTQLIVTTHSDILVDAMTETPEVVVVCEKHEGKTEMRRLSAEDLKVWLEKYRLGQLWIEGQLGGKRW